MIRELVDLPLGKFLFTRVSFDGTCNAPYFRLMDADGVFVYARPAGNFTLTFDLSRKRCTGWYDMRTGECYECPGKRAVSEKYEQCPECQRKTGFNPAFYNTTELSVQQAELNKKPHLLYLAYFSSETVKVGISNAERGLARLLEQGARSAVILETFPSANVARQYEAQIARLPGLCESVQLRKKAQILVENSYDEVVTRQKLEQVIAVIQRALNIQFSNPQFAELSSIMINGTALSSCTAIELWNQPRLSGAFVGLLGQLLIMEQQNRLLVTPMKQYLGNYVTIAGDVAPLDLTPVQTSLF